MPTQRDADVPNQRVAEQLDQVDLAGYSVGSMIGLRVLQAASRRSEYIQAVYEEQQS